MSSPDRSFDLIDQPWIQLRMLDGSVGECSLTETFRRAHQASGIVGEISTMTFAITRLLLAILHRAVDGPVDIEHWTALWAEEILPDEAICRYLDTHRARFDLLHPVTPFYQVADLRSAKNETSGLERLIADIPNGIAYFSNRSGTALESIGYAEAARWLVHAQAYETAGIKTGAVGDDRVKSGRGYGIGTGWCGNIGGLLMEGATLRETLLLNLIAESSKYIQVDSDDLPVWERAPHTASEEVTGGRTSRGPLDSYTWQKARIHLVESDGRITQVLMCNGDRATLHNQHLREPMTGWRRSANQEKNLGLPLVYMPRVHTSARAMWRGIAALLPSRVGNVQRADGADRLVPGVVSWISELRADGALLDDQIVRARAYGLEYGTQSAVITEILDDAISVHIALLNESAVVLGEQIELAVQRADNAVWSLGVLAADVATAAGGEVDGPKTRAVEAGHAALDGPFRSWVTSLKADSDPLAARTAWDTTAQSIVTAIARDIVESAPASSMVLRPPRKICTPMAENEFRSRMRKIYADHATTTTEENKAR
ncbi:MAG TPA: type I-E CRISPR-associated protein Cse1/CasA [Candidatus Acidoferrum sp.]|nr:type I-E CRISPR-associated protein Cse1/CasA [Candidatus Acidoferrum sp.]